MELPPLHDGRYKTKIDRFWPRVDVRGPDECWPWTGPTEKQRGYGLIKFSGGITRAHRVAYELVVAKPPPRWHVHHHCGNRTCCNPGHMEAMPAAAHRRIHNPKGPESMECEKCGAEKGAVLYGGRMRYVCHPCEAERKRKERMS